MGGRYAGAAMPYAATLKKLEPRLTPEQLTAARNAAQAWQKKFAASQQ